jgi:predicted dithiol-disulfide oxidoreductase (DUF899 family)
MDTVTTTVGTREEWTAARLELLAREKQLNRLRDELAEERRRLPWVRVDNDYRFDGPHGQRSLRDLFDGRSQLLVYLFMFGPDWDEGCPSCSFWADSFDGTAVHLAHRDVTFACIARAPYDKLAAYQTRMGWTFPWYSSAPGDFNFDFGVSFTSEQQEHGGTYNFTHQDHPNDEMPGISAFAHEPAGDVFHTYSSYSRGLDPINGAYQLLDLTPRGRDESDLPWPMAWVRRHDAYDD